MNILSTCKTLTLFLCGLLLSPALPAQNDHKELTRLIQTNNEKLAREKIYIHTDKEYYRPGEDIWFKAYLLRNGMPEAESKTLYLQLIDGKGSLLEEKKLFVEGSSASGSFDLPPGSPEGFYTLRAYTNWMRNSDPSFWYHSILPVWSNQVYRRVNESVQPQTFSVKFYPEGGQLLNGIPAKISFKAEDPAGLPVHVTGKLTDNNGNEIATINDFADGLGSFDLLPKAGHTYTAVLTSSNGLKQTFALPPAQQEGISFGLEKMRNGFYFNIQSSAGYKTSRELNLIAEMDQHIVASATLPRRQDKIRGFVPTGLIQPGAVKVGLYDGMTQIAERWIYIRHQDAPQPLRVKPQVFSNAGRGFNSWELEIADSLVGNYSVSVTDADRVISEPLKNNIQSSLQINSVLGNPFRHYAAYISDFTDATEEKLELLMLTLDNRIQQPAAAAQIKPGYPVEKGLSLYGKLYRPMQSGKVLSLIVQGRDPRSNQTILTQPDEDGNFNVPNVLLFDSVLLFSLVSGSQSRQPEFPEIIISPQDENGLARTSGVEKFYSGTGQPAPLSISRNTGAQSPAIKQWQSSHIDKYGKSIMLDSVTVKARREKQITPENTGTSRTGIATNDTDIPGTLPNLRPRNQVWGGPDTDVTVMLGQAFDMSMPSGTLNAIRTITNNLNQPTFINGMNVGVLNQMDMTNFWTRSLNPASTQLYQTQGVRRYQQSLMAPRAVGRMVMGYEIPRKFFSPDYTDKLQQTIPTDDRQTIYWEPVITIDGETRKGKINFYNNDFTKRFRIIVEGVNQNGKPVRLEKIIER